jgi:hypothetical protein
MVERHRSDDWKKYDTHARFTSNPDENIARFQPGGLKRQEMLLETQVHLKGGVYGMCYCLFCGKHLRSTETSTDQSHLPSRRNP